MICKRTCLGYWDFPLDELEAFWLKYSWLCKICRKAESQILLSSNPNFMLYIKIDHAAAAVVVCRLSLRSLQALSLWWCGAGGGCLSQESSKGRWPFYFLPPAFPAETNPQHWCGCYWIFHTKGSPPCSVTVTLGHKHLCPASWV